jgi:hypothetical protein
VIKKQQPPKPHQESDNKSSISADLSDLAADLRVYSALFSKMMHFHPQQPNANGSTKQQLLRRRPQKKV